MPSIRITPEMQELTTTQQPTLGLRWHRGVLQQQWMVTSYINGMAAIAYPWRDVPTDDAVPDGASESEMRQFLPPDATPPAP